MADTTDTAAPSPCLAMPGELRNDIYRMTIVQPQAVHALTSQACTDSPQTAYKIRVPALALVCREIRDEVLSIYFAENTFIFRTSTCRDQRESNLHRSNLAWFEMIGKHVKNVKSIRAVPGPGHLAQRGGIDIKIDKAEKVFLTARKGTHYVCNNGWRPGYSMIEHRACKCALDQAARQFTANLMWASVKDVLKQAIGFCALGKGSQYIGEDGWVKRCEKCGNWRKD